MRLKDEKEKIGDRLLHRVLLAPGSGRLGLQCCLEDGLTPSAGGWSIPLSPPFNATPCSQHHAVGSGL